MPRHLHCDRIICGIVVLLSFFGLVMVFSATTGGEEAPTRFVVKQALAIAIGLAAMRILMFIDYRHLRRPRVVFAVMGISVTLLVVVLFGAQTANTNRFLRLGSISFQPSELAKFALILFLAFYLDRHARKLAEWRTLARAGVILGMLFLLVVGGKDLGGVIVLALIASVMFWVAGLDMRYFALAGLGSLPLLAVAIWWEPYRMQRLTTFLNPEADPKNAGFQILQSQIAVGTGGLFGKGLMDGHQKMRFLPEAHTDFIFALVCEELGFIVAILVVLAFGVLLWRGVRVARRAPDRFGTYLAVGITAMIVCQALVNLGVVLGLLPTKGMPLPFVSYGGSAMIVALASSGILLNVSQHAE
ncbi:MAG: putative lipid II flippase FtsW [Acidobacteria bacterium]|nr:putative lipid II flippase FtsW [Acidobacteriota bacterium]